MEKPPEFHRGESYTSSETGGKGHYVEPTAAHVAPLKELGKGVPSPRYIYNSTPSEQ